ncbi:MAG: hypothetical protein L0332_34265, partial [Chloroflexi bacterium]|nr:hypothetical protein [Chloroflexota bacterium]
VAAAFDQNVYYWKVTDTRVERIGSRRTDGPVQAIAYLGTYDLVTTPRSMSTSLVGSVQGGDSTRFDFPGELGAVEGSPAIYGDIIYVVTKSGEVAAIGR